MYFVQQGFPTLAENLAFDEFMLVHGEQTGHEFLRVWEWPPFAVVLGAGGIVADDVNVAACQADGVEIARRSSGGGTVLLGKGCMSFSLVLRFDRAHELMDVRRSYPWILERVLAGLRLPASDLAIQGVSDLTYCGRKFSGNAQQRKRTHLLHHGTLLYGMDLAKIPVYLREPPRQPDYRERRSHGDFIGGIPLSAEDLANRLREAWHAEQSMSLHGEDAITESVRDRFGNAQWIFRR